MNKKETSYALGVDVGGSHITVGVVDLVSRTIDKGRLERHPVDSKGSITEVLDAWAGAIAPLCGKEALSTIQIGIAMPGPFDYDAGISFIDSTQDKYESLYRKNVKDLLAKKLGIANSQVRFKNDAACFLQGEVFAGIAKGYKRAIGMTLGTGAGTAYYHGTEAHDAARWGEEFSDSIAEEYFSTRWFAKKYQEATGQELSGVRELVDMKEESWVQGIFKEFGHNLGKFLGKFASEENAEIIVLGGSIAHSSALFLPETAKVLSQFLQNVPIKKSILGEESALIGAASCWYEE
ncbi:ROK family protein [Echinicola strongylocentroti]|uniref:ROK family protein n=1 Tax=Echinicola strongylocentroti TaxID=1795355 RepID=A0A2Z4IDY4_9BACT|nr:ROK family protein [Echinicola strongylocentroti]AWW29281.1 ROK family protein [Echinicola strongylocentroti]